MGIPRLLIIIVLCEILIGTALSLATTWLEQETERLKAELAKINASKEKDVTE